MSISAKFLNEVLKNNFTIAYLRIMTILLPLSIANDK